jgi:hypothetical protein
MSMAGDAAMAAARDYSAGVATMPFSAGVWGAASMAGALLSPNKNAATIA